MTTDFANCYAASLLRLDLGELRPGGLGVAFGFVSREIYNALWAGSNRTKNITVFKGACLSGLSLDRLELLDTLYVPPKTSPQDYLLAAFTRVYKGNPDFHFAYSPEGTREWLHTRRVQYCADDPPFLVDEPIPNPQAMIEDGIASYEFLTLARIPPDHCLRSQSPQRR